MTFVASFDVFRRLSAALLVIEFICLSILGSAWIEYLTDFGDMEAAVLLDAAGPGGGLSMPIARAAYAVLWVSALILVGAAVVLSKPTLLPRRVARYWLIASMLLNCLLALLVVLHLFEAPWELRAFWVFPVALDSLVVGTCSRALCVWRSSGGRADQRLGVGGPVESTAETRLFGN